MILKKGSLAYLDSFAGLVPCKVLKIVDTSDPTAAMQFDLCKGGIPSRYRVTIRLTANHGAYKKGEMLEQFAHDVVPREAVKWRKYSPIIWAYEVEVTK